MAYTISQVDVTSTGNRVTNIITVEGDWEKFVIVRGSSWGNVMNLKSDMSHNGDVKLRLCKCNGHDDEDLTNLEELTKPEVK